MQFTVEQIRSVRNNYLEPPYPGFSLDEVCRKRRMAQTKLVRGENAWSAKGTAQTTDEWVQRLVQGSLNKMSERNYDTLVAKLRTKELFATKDILESVVAIIFQKAMDEPENSKLYAGLCYHLALFESSLNETRSEKLRLSELRNAIVTTAEREFEVARRAETESEGGLSDEEREFRRANFMRRRKANVRFVAELCLSRTMSIKKLLEIIEGLVGNMRDGDFPEPDNIELFDEFFRTAGSEIEKQDKAAVDGYFSQLAALIKRQDTPYPHRIRFKIMDLLDYRKAAWGTKARVVKSSSMSGGGGGGSNSKRPTAQASATSPLSPTNRKGKSEGTGAGAWRGGPPKFDNDSGSAKAGKGGRPSAVGAAVVPSSSLASRVADVRASSPAAPSPAPAASAPKKSFELRVHAMFQEWVSDCTNDFIPQWINEFADCDRQFDSDEELCVAVAMEVIKEACTTTRKDAQREACSFLIVGLFLEDAEMLRGFGGALASAMDDGLLEDVPKFPERFMQMVRLTSSEDDINADVYYDAANVLCMAYNHLDSPDEYTVDTLMSFWARVPRQELNCAEEDRVVLNYPVIYTLCENPHAKPGLERLVSAVIHSLYEMNIVEQGTIDELLSRTVDTNPLYAKIVAKYKELYGAGEQ